MKCYGQVEGRGWCQEHYETATNDARQRAREIRKAGLKATVIPMGPQVTPVGLVKMTMVDIRSIDGSYIDELPPVELVRMG